MQLIESLKQKSKKHIIFDFDGVVFQIDWHHGEPLDDYRKRLWNTAKDIDPTIYNEMIDEPITTIYTLTDKLTQKHGSRARETILKLFEEKESTLIDTASPHEDIINFIEENHQSYNFYIWSNNMTISIIKILERRNLVQYFDKIIGVDKVSHAKPNVEGFNLIFDPNTQTKSEFIMTGDFKSDEIAATNAGIDFVYYP